MGQLAYMDISQEYTEIVPVTLFNNNLLPKFTASITLLDFPEEPICHFTTLLPSLIHFSKAHMLEECSEVLESQVA